MLYCDSKFCLLDEPFTGISPIIVQNMLVLIREESKHKGIVIVDHDCQSLLEIVNTFYYLENGTLYHLKEASELVNYGYIYQI